MSDLVSRPYNPDPASSCSACVFGSGKHAEYCHLYVKPGCICYLTAMEEFRGEPHASECPLSKLRAA
jgi:hypothetical protein